MDKLLDYVCDELEELEHKAEREGKLTVAEVEYGDMLAHFKKNLLTADAMMNPDDYSYDDGMSMRGRGRYAKRDSMGRYSKRGYDDRYSRTDAKEDLLHELKDLDMDAKDEETKQMLKSWIRQLETR